MALEALNNSGMVSKAYPPAEATGFALSPHEIEGFNRVMMEAWGDRIDLNEHLSDDPAWDFQASPISNFEDKQDGRFRPFFDNEYELARLRGEAHLIQSFASAVNIKTNLTNYTIGKGFQFKAQAKSDATRPELVERVQRVIDAFLDDNDWTADREHESHDRSREDGEVFLWLQPNGWKTRVRELEPEQITEPANSRQLDEWLGDTGNPTSWSFGIRTETRDPQTPLAYHAIFDGAGNDFEVIPASRLEHIKRNVPRNVKRGLTDFYPVRQFLNRSEKLLRNTAVGSAIQAAIAYIKEYPQGTPGTAIAGDLAGAATSTETVTTQRRTETRKIHQHEPGMILGMPKGVSYQAGPLGQQHSPQHVGVLQAALRYCGIRWQMPEYMISGDASNANMASTLVAESPFVKGRETDQFFYSSRYRRMMWKAVHVAWRAGFFDDLQANYELLQQLVEIAVECPAVASRDLQALSGAYSTLINDGVISRETACNRIGEEWETEVGRGAEPAAQPAAQQAAGMETLQGALEQTFVTLGCSDEVREILESLNG